MRHERLYDPCKRRDVSSLSLFPPPTPPSRPPRASLQRAANSCLTLVRLCQIISLIDYLWAMRHLERSCVSLLPLVFPQEWQKSRGKVESLRQGFSWWTYDSSRSITVVSSWHKTMLIQHNIFFFNDRNSQKIKGVIVHSWSTTRDQCSFT